MIIGIGIGCSCRCHLRSIINDNAFALYSLDEEEIEVGWSAQKVSNMLHMLMVIRTLVAPSNPTNVTASCQVLNKINLYKACLKNNIFFSEHHHVLWAVGKVVLDPFGCWNSS